MKVSNTCWPSDEPQETDHVKRYLCRISPQIRAAQAKVSPERHLAVQGHGVRLARHLMCSFGVAMVVSQDVRDMHSLTYRCCT